MNSPAQKPRSRQSVDGTGASVHNTAFLLIARTTLCGAIVCGYALVNSLPSSAQTSAQPVQIANRLELFVDSLLIESMDGTRLRLHEPVRAVSSHPPSDGHYATVLKDGDVYRLYNRAGKSEYDGSPGERTEYFESDDGIHWRRPVLGLFDVEGSKQNNVVLAGSAPFSRAANSR